MKIYPFFFQVSLAFTLFLITANVGRTQSGNMSDITQPNPIEMTPETETDTDTDTDTDTEDITPTDNPADPALETSNANPPTTPTGSQTPESQTSKEPQADTTGDSTSLEGDNQTNTNSPGENPTETNESLAENDQNGSTSPEQNEQGDSSNLDRDNQDGNESPEQGETNDNLEKDTQTSDKSPEETESDPNAEETNETDTQSEEEEVAKEETETEEEVESVQPQEVNRIAYETEIQGASTDVAVQLHEEFQVTQLVSASGVQLYGKIPSVDDISHRLGQLWQQTGNKPAFVNVSVQSNQLETFVVLPTGTNTALNYNKNDAKGNLNSYDSAPTEAIRQTVQSSSRKEILKIAKRFREEVSNSRSIGRSNYLESAQKLYQWIIQPLEAELAKNDIDILVFSMDSGLSLIPIAALHDGKQFLVEKYAVAVVPSFGLTDTRYVNINQSPVLAMGASEFADQAPLPTMSLELLHATQNPRQGEVFLNEEFTVNNFIVQNRLSQQSKIIHLGTHAEFKTGDFKNSYIQFSDRKLKLPELMQISDELGWSTNDNTPIELLVLSACETALGDKDSELGFAGLAVQAGVKSALASLWYISDLGTLALMSEFYDNLSDNLVKAEALRATQLSMLRGEVKVKDRELILSNGESVTLPSTFPQGSLTLSEPYFWSAFTLIGNWN